MRCRDKRGQKVFINVCKCDDVAAPGKKRQLIGDEVQEGINIPLSATRGRDDTDSRTRHHHRRRSLTAPSRVRVQD